MITPQKRVQSKETITDVDVTENIQVLESNNTPIMETNTVSTEENSSVDTFVSGAVNSAVTETKAHIVYNKIKHLCKNPYFVAVTSVVLLVVVLLIVLLLVYKDNPASENIDNNETTNVTSVTMSDEEFFDYLLYGNNGEEQEPTETTENIFYAMEREEVFSNSAVVGYLNIAGTDVHYNVVQAADNVYYLDKDESGVESKSGAIYGDYRNNFNQLDLNNVIYGHNMASGLMFGTLTRLLAEDFYTVDNQNYLQFNSEYYNNVFRIYSVYEIDLTTFNYIQTGFTDDVEFAEFVSKTQELNSVQALKGIKVPADTRLLTLSTCTEGGTKRLVVHGFLYAREVY